MMPGRTGCTAARFFQGISRFLQPLTNGPFGSLCAMSDRLAGGFRTMLNGLACFFRSFLNGLTSFFYWTLILGSHCERYAN
jgi:hypothetical protein